MNSEIQSLVRDLQKVIDGVPWYGTQVMEMLGSVDPAIVYKKPNKHHSLIELLYHMIMWSDFTLQRIEGKPLDPEEIKRLDWREIDPRVHTWQKGVEEFRRINGRIAELVLQKDDSLLDQIVGPRKYTYREMLTGITQHHVYHLGQIAYVKKLLE